MKAATRHRITRAIQALAHFLRHPRSPEVRIAAMTAGTRLVFERGLRGSD